MTLMEPSRSLTDGRSPRCDAEHAAAEAPEELHGLRADEHEVHGDVLLLPGGHLADHALEEVDVQPAAQAAVRGNDDEADAPDFALRHVRVFVFRVRMRQVADDAADALGVGPRRLHLPLCLADLARGDFFHGARDLLHVFHRSDLRADLFLTCHVISSPLSRPWAAPTSPSRAAIPLP
jgi:hypothetical protein